MNKHHFNFALPIISAIALPISSIAYSADSQSAIDVLNDKLQEINKLQDELRTKQNEIGQQRQQLEEQLTTQQRQAEEREAKLSTQVQELQQKVEEFKYGWTLVYGNSATGITTDGSLAALVNAVRKGKDVKIFSGAESYYVCGYIFVLEDNSSVSCMDTQHVSVRSIVPGATFGFQDNAYHWFVMVNTKGQRDMSRWNVGEHVDRGHTQDTTALQWFVRN